MTAFASIVGAGFEGCMLTAAAGHQIVIADDDDLLMLEDGDVLACPTAVLVATGQTRVRAVGASIYVERLDLGCDGCAVEGRLIALAFPACPRHANSYPLCPEHGGEWAPFQCRRCGP